MKYVKNILLLVLVAAFSASCGKPAPLPPDEVAVKFYNDLTSGDLRFAKRHLYFPNPVDYDTFCEYLDMAVRSEEYWERTEGYKADYRVVDTKIYGDEAYVIIRGATPLHGDATMTVHLLFIDEMWKVDGNHGVLHRH